MAGPTALTGSGSLSARPSAEEQMYAAAAELASSAAPLARLALPTFSEGLANVLQVSPHVPKPHICSRFPTLSLAKCIVFLFGLVIYDSSCWVQQA